MELMRLKGTNGTIIAYEDRVVVERTGLFAFASHGFKGDKTYFYSDLSSIGFRKPGMANGYMQFIVAGSNPSKPTSDLFGTSKETMRDENVVVLRAFDKSVPESSEKLYNLILDKMSGSRNRNSSPSAPVSGADEIKKYNDLYKQGIISEAEFNAAKKKILGI